MSSLRHLLIADLAGAAPRPGETLVWVGPVDPPVSITARSRIVRASTSADALALIDSGPAVVRFALRQPLGFVNALTSQRSTEARAA